MISADSTSIQLVTIGFIRAHHLMNSLLNTASFAIPYIHIQIYPYTTSAQPIYTTHYVYPPSLNINICTSVPGPYIDIYIPHPKLRPTTHHLQRKHHRCVRGSFSLDAARGYTLASCRRASLPQGAVRHRGDIDFFARADCPGVIARLPLRRRRRSLFFIRGSPRAAAQRQPRDHRTCTCQRHRKNLTPSIRHRRLRPL